MAAKDDMTMPVFPGFYYHIFNRGNNRGQIFFTEENYRFFLASFRDKCSGYVDTLGYCLLANHFHFLVKIRSSDEILVQALKDQMEGRSGRITGDGKAGLLVSDLARMVGGDSSKSGVLGTSSSGASIDMTYFKNMSYLLNTQTNTYIQKLCAAIVSEKFRALFVSYSKAVNKQQERTGSLLQRPFRRKCISTPGDLKYVLTYIHHNPIHHGLTNQFADYNWSSFNPLMYDPKTWLHENEVLNLFGSKVNFYHFHNAFQNQKNENIKPNFDIPFPEEIRSAVPVLSL